MSGAAAPQPDVLIVGAGLAGLAASVALSGAGLKISVLERKPHVGGRAYSYPHPALAEEIDSQHVLVGCCTNLIDLCAKSGADRHIRWYDTIPFLEPSTKDRPNPRRSELGTGRLPAPAHGLPGLLSASMLSAGDKLSISRALLGFLRGYPQSDEEPFSAWLDRARQSASAIRHFWEPLVVSTLNDSFERSSTRYAGQVFHELFMKSSQGGRQGIPTLPLSVFYALFARLAEARGAHFVLRSGVDRLDYGNGLWHATTVDGNTHTAPKILLALPFDQTARLLATLPEASPQRQAISPLLTHFHYAPFTTIHLWLDREITDLDQAALLDTTIQWMFNKTRIRRDEPNARDGFHYLELVIAASFKELKRSREDILAGALAELPRFFPTAREATVLKSGVLKEAKATFSVLPGLEQYRPVAAAPGNGMFLAGDWTRTGWPSTMEGAVRSGNLAAEAIVHDGGGQAHFLAPDLPPGALMRLLSTSRN